MVLLIARGLKQVQGLLKIMQQINQKDPDFWQEATTSEGHAQLKVMVGGMQCSLCAGIIESTIGKRPGVHKVSANLPDEQVLIEYDREQLSVEQLLSLLRDLGFQIGRPGTTHSLDEDTIKLKHEGRLVLAGFVLSAITIPLMFLEMWHQVGGWVGWALGVLAIATVFLLTPQLVVMAVQSRRRGLLNQPVVVQASAFGGLAGGVIGLVAKAEDYPTGGFFAVTVLVVTYYVFSRWFALLVRTQNSQAVKKLLELQPDTVRLVRDEMEGEVPLKAVSVGDLMRIKPGERLPLDGRVVSGRSAVDESLVTGESMPKQKSEDDEVVGGSINGKGTLLVEVTQVGENSFLQRVIHSIEDARGLKPGILDMVGRVLKVYVPSVMAFALLAGVFWIVFPIISGQEANYNRALFAVLSVLIMAYPCAVGMAAPLALVRGAGEAAEKGIILRTGEAFQAFGAVNHIILDKTGTLTEGAFTVREVEAIGDRDQLLALAAAAELSSEHPVGTAIVSAARDRRLMLPNTQEFESVTGDGIRVKIDDSVIFVGRPSFVAGQVGKPNPLASRVTELEEAGRTVVMVSRDDEFLGLIALGDEIRADTRNAIDEMKRQGITPVLVTGDNHLAAQRVARELGIEDVRAEILPTGKADIVRSLQRMGRVAIVGDGINDAPALTQADVGIAMGSGADIAIESADIIILGNRLDAVLNARDIGIRSYRRTKQNVVLAFLFNGIGVPLAATGLLYPIWAMVVMIVSVTAVLANSMRGKWSLVFATIRNVATSGRGLQQGKELYPRIDKG